MKTKTTTTTAEILRIDGTRETVAPANGCTFTLEEMQSAVGGYIEILAPRSPDGRLIVVNEEGKRTCPDNPLATMLLGHLLFAGDYISGNVLLCPEAMLD